MLSLCVFFYLLCVVLGVFSSNHIAEENRTGCFTLFVLCSMSLPRDILVNYAFSIWLCQLLVVLSYFNEIATSLGTQPC